MSKVHDYVVVGSGCAGSMAAQTLVEAGANVTMLDVGATSTGPKAPAKDFIDIRKQEANQYKYLVGENGEGIAYGNVSKGAQVTPTRGHMTWGVDKYLPLESNSFSPLESLGYGGLGIGWGLQCWEYSSADLKRAGLDPARMYKAYETVSKRIGISATKDAAAPYTINELAAYQPSARMDRNHERIYKKYLARQSGFERSGFYVGRTPLALITQDLGDRKAYQYNDMDYYADNGRSAWRPWITVDELRKKPNFSYEGSHLVLSFKEKDGLVEINCLDTKTDEQKVVRARKLILAGGAFASARIVLRSQGTSSTELPFLSNPHAYIPCLQPTMAGKAVEPHKLGFGQLSYFIDKEGGDSGISVASSYSYQSLMLFRIINQVPLDLADARAIMRYLLSGIIIMIAQHPDSASPGKYLRLVKDSSSVTGDKLQARYSLTAEEEAEWDRREKAYVKAMRKLGVHGLKRIHPPHGSSIHYAGTLPFSKTKKRFTLAPDGRLNGAKNVYVADSSGFNHLPAKGLTFSLMANAHLTAESVLKNE